MYECKLDWVDACCNYILVVHNCFSLTRGTLCSQSKDEQTVFRPCCKATRNTTFTFGTRTGMLQNFKQRINTFNQIKYASGAHGYDDNELKIARTCAYAHSKVTRSVSVRSSPVPACHSWAWKIPGTRRKINMIFKFRFFWKISGHLPC